MALTRQDQIERRGVQELPEEARNARNQLITALNRLAAAGRLVVFDPSTATLEAAVAACENGEAIQVTLA